MRTKKKHRIDAYRKKLIDEICTQDVYCLDPNNSHRSIRWNPSWKRKNKTIVDIGSNIGVFSGQAASIYPDSTIIAAEMNQEYFNISQETLQQHKNVKLINVAIVGSAKPAKYFSHQHSLGGDCLVYESRGHNQNTENFKYNHTHQNTNKFRGTLDDFKEFNIQYLTLSELLYQNNIQHVDYLKMDVEGSEYEIMEHFWANCSIPVDNFVVEYHFRYPNYFDKKVKSSKWKEKQNPAFIGFYESLNHKYKTVFSHAKEIKSNSGLIYCSELR